MENTCRHFDVAKCYPPSLLRDHDAKIQITHAEHRRYKVQLSDENQILIDKSMLERYRKYKCCVFIDFEYMIPLPSTTLTCGVRQKL